MRLDLARTSIAALLLRRRRPVLAGKLLPPDRARGADTEPYRRLPTRQTARPQSLPQPYPEGPSTMLAPYMPASKTGMHPEAENRSDGNPPYDSAT